MADREPNHQLAATIKRAGASNKGLARRVCEVGAEHGADLRYDHVAVSRWLAGTQPKGLVPHFIAEALSRKLGEPVTLTDIGMDARDDAALLGLDYAERPTESLERVTGLLRTDLSGDASAEAPSLNAASWNEVMLQWLLPASDEPGSTPQRSLISAATVETVQVTTEMFAKLDYRFGGGHARMAVLQYLDTDVMPLWRDADPTSPLDRELMEATAALLRLVGWTAYDSGLHGMAQRYLVQALRLADAAGARMLGGRILAGMSHQANFLGYHDHAVKLARAARQGAHDQATPTAMMLFYAMEARAHAAKGDAASSTKALSRAERLFDRRNPDDDPAWLLYFDEAELAAEFAHCYRDIGEGPEAEKWAAHSIATSEALYVRSLSFVRTVLATSHIQQGEVEQGLAVADEVVSTTAGLRSARCLAYVQDFLRRLDGMRQDRTVKEFLDRTANTLPMTDHVAPARVRSSRS
ncbi:MAG: hypothetical protein ACRDPK_01555 [Carbonactinosporaceae bacterium]